MFLGCYLFVHFNVNPVLRTVAEEQVRALTTLAVNNSAQAVLGESFGYGDIITISRDEAGDIALIQINTTLINTLARKTVSDSQAAISSLGEQGVKVKLGSLSGITIFAGKGPDISIKVYTVGSMDSTLSSVFESAGINQTRHLIKLTLTSKVSAIIPGPNQTITTTTDLILSESLIIGKVPEVYLQSNDLSNMLDLVP